MWGCVTMPDDMAQWAKLRGAEPLAGMLAQLHAAAATRKPGRDCREDIEAAIAAVDAVLEGANA